MIIAWTWKTKVAAAGLGLVVLVGSFAAGRWTAAKPLERDHIVTSERDTSLEWHAYVGRTVSVAKTETQWKTVTRWEPGGTVVQIREAAQKTETSTTKDETVTAARETTVARQLEVTHETKPAVRPDWLFAARAGVDASLSPIYGASVSRRVLGPLYVEAWGQKPLAGGIGLALAF